MARWRCSRRQSCCRSDRTGRREWSTCWRSSGRPPSKTGLRTSKNSVTLAVAIWPLRPGHWPAPVDNGHHVPTRSPKSLNSHGRLRPARQTTPDRWPRTGIRGACRPVGEVDLQRLHQRRWPVDRQGVKMSIVGSAGNGLPSPREARYCRNAQHPAREPRPADCRSRKR